MLYAQAFSEKSPVVTGRGEIAGKTRDVFDSRPLFYRKTMANPFCQLPATVSVMQGVTFKGVFYARKNNTTKQRPIQAFIRKIKASKKTLLPPDI